MLLIFYLSSQIGKQSDQLSIGITTIIVRTIEQILPKLNVDISYLNSIVRKITHFLIYLVLGFLVMNALMKSYKSGVKFYIISALLICMIYAISDEIHQLFIPGRGAHLTDVIIDIFGSIFGIGILAL